MARAALLEQAGATDVGEHLGHVVEDDRVVTHQFRCTRRGYRGWHWSVTVARASRQKQPTVDEVVLVPGGEAIVAPAWVPWKERIKPGDLSPGDLLPIADDDPRVVPTYLAGDADSRELAREVGLGRPRSLSIEGRNQVASRWYAGPGGPEAPVAKSAPATCSSCAFLVALSGPLAELFGVCANAQANADGRVVSVDHGCGAHSEAQLTRKQLPQALPDPVLDTITRDDLETF